MTLLDKTSRVVGQEKEGAIIVPLLLEMLLSWCPWNRHQTLPQ